MNPLPTGATSFSQARYALALLVPTVLLGMLVNTLIQAQKARFQRHADSVVIERALVY